MQYAYNTLSLFTRVGIVCIEEIDLLAPVSVHITGSDSNSVPCCIPQGVVRRVAVIHGDVYELVLIAVVLEHQVGPVIPEEEQGRQKV